MCINKYVRYILCKRKAYCKKGMGHSEDFFNLTVIVNVLIYTVSFFYFNKKIAKIGKNFCTDIIFRSSSLRLMY